MSKKGEHEWWTWVPIPTEVLKNEDNVYSFRFRFDVARGLTGLDQAIVAQFDAHTTGCGKCQGELEDVFGEFCPE